METEDCQPPTGAELVAVVVAVAFSNAGTRGGAAAAAEQHRQPDYVHVWALNPESRNYEFQFAASTRRSRPLAGTGMGQKVLSCGRTPVN